jgi:hypothetical protein
VSVDWGHCQGSRCKFSGKSALIAFLGLLDEIGSLTTSVTVAQSFDGEFLSRFVSHCIAF